ncbi:Uncharacterised protein [Candidatus Tiddalikarchaeum anstoanum]|nr:Uncharacterised protein [Candidatus Tiddalikarchaeum anstoanum]
MDIKEIFDVMTVSSESLAISPIESRVHFYIDFEEMIRADTTYSKANIVKIGNKKLIFALGEGYYHAGRGGGGYKFSDIAVLQTLGSSPSTEIYDRLKNNSNLVKSILMSKGDEILTGIKLEKVVLQETKNDILNPAFDISKNQITNIVSAVKKYYFKRGFKKKIKEIVLKENNWKSKMINLSIALDLPIDSSFQGTSFWFNYTYFMKILGIKY